MPRPHTTLYLLILCSGLSALLYQIIWSRHLSLLFGSNMLAVGTVAATFMVGLAIGSLIFGSRADHSKNPLRLYAFLEAGIALTALLFPVILDLIRELYILVAVNVQDSAMLSSIFRVTLTVIALLPPTICMGGTLPVLCRFLSSRQPGRQVGVLYALNTFGAVAGCLVGGFFLIPESGMLATQTVAIAVNLVIAVIAWRLSQNTAVATADSSSTEVTTRIGLLSQRVLLGGAFLLGATALAYEMLWTRLFLLFLGNTTYAFSTILGVFLIGLAIGSTLYARLLAQRSNPSLVYFALLSAMLLFILATLPVYDQLGFLFESIHRKAENNWWALAMMSLLGVALPVLVPAILSGALFPATVTLMQSEQNKVGRVVGRILFWNTLGSALGSFIGVFAINLFGLQNSFKVVVFLALLFAIAFARAYRLHLPIRTVSALLVFCAVLLAVPSRWDQGLMNSGIYLYAHYYLSSGGLGHPMVTMQPEDVVEGIETTAAFFRSADGYKEFRVNGKSDGGTRPGDMKTQVLLGQLPMLFHRGAESALVIGLGTGITLRQVLDYPVKRVDCAEISPEVVAISRHFSLENDQVLNSPKVNLLIQDGRNLLLTGKSNYDVIISEPSNPWQTGNANLFTREFYQLAVSKLNTQGVFCQWLPLYDLPTPRLQIALQTFADSFSNVRMFLLGGDMILLGSSGPENLDLKRFDNLEATASMTLHLSLAGLDFPQQLLERYYFANQDFLKLAAKQVPLNTDDLPFLEFTRQTGLDLSRINLGYLVDVRQRRGDQPSESPETKL